MGRRTTRRLIPGAVTLALLVGAAPSAVIAGPSSAAADAAQNRNLTALRALLGSKADVNAAQPDGTTALHWAAHWNDAEAVMLLLRAGANPKATNRYGASPLSEAVTSGSAATIDALLKAGADPKTLTTADGETVLMTASRAGNLDGVRMLLDHGADVNAKETYRGQTALMWAAAERQTAVVKLLLERGADWKVRSFDRETRPPRLSAASSISPIPRGGFTALLFAAREGDIETTRVMLDAGVDVNYGDVDNTSALVVAIMNKQYTLARFLIDRGADPNLVDASGRTALYAAIDIRNEDWSALPNRKSDDLLPSLDVVKALLDRGANLDTPLTRPLPGRSGMDSGDTTLGPGTTPLMRAARSGDAAVIRLLLAKGADAKLATKDGTTALMFAAGVGYRDKNTRGTEAEALEALKVLVEAGLDLRLTNTRGETALHGAASRGADTIVQYLVDHGAELNRKTKQGFTPLDIAMGKAVVIQLPVPQESTVALLRKLGGVEGKDLK
ncbi:MAG TPA: ankyrin repeat domain-containing protein [Vicinamibacterales bacterium]|nr:ankyrin repeat domain-containing protein [Vicinamibacterales bacterium]